jgi:hypothetical protein
MALRLVFTAFVLVGASASTSVDGIWRVSGSCSNNAVQHITMVQCGADVVLNVLDGNGAPVGASRGCTRAVCASMSLLLKHARVARRVS